MLQLHFRHPLSHKLEHIKLQEPAVVLQALRADEVLPQLQALQDWQAKGYAAVGYLAYEAAAAWLPTPCHKPLAVNAREAALPLLWFAVFEPQYLEVVEETNSAANGLCSYTLEPWLPRQNEAEFGHTIATIKAAIARGETYQVNYTLPFDSALTGSPAALYAAMRQAQQAPYAAYLEVGEQAILSASPELFFHWDGQTKGRNISTQPMKGTRPRGLWATHDQALATELASSAKDRAENVMIVDLLRNDLGRVAQTGSVKVEELFAIERYPSVWQMTSRISAQTRSEIDLCAILQALFPCGSITGAPKQQTMQLIAQQEVAPRGAYCGSIGLLRPDGSATFSVAIRTLTLNAATPTGQRPAHYHAGAGITWSSETAAEWQEVQAKTRVVQADFLRQQNATPFGLIETLLWADGEFAWLSGHQTRLAQSAHYHGFVFEPAVWLSALQAAVQSTPATSQRLRAVLHASGRVEVSSTPLPDSQPSWLQAPSGQVGQRFVLASAPISSGEARLYHKTTQRQIYETAKQAAPAGVFDVLLHNEVGQLCEFTIGNLLLQLDGKIYTPPISCGLLPGVLRAELLARGLVEERLLHIEDLTCAQGIWLINSVRGWLAMQLQP